MSKENGIKVKLYEGTMWVTSLSWTRFLDNNEPCLIANCRFADGYEEYQRLSINDREQKAPEGYTWLKDYSENALLCEQLFAASWIEKHPTAVLVLRHCAVPAVKVTDKAIITEGNEL
jgi:hypothetical protein